VSTSRACRPAWTLQRAEEEGRADDTPDAILAAPADDFVASFVGEDRALRRLALLQLGGVELESADGVDGPTAPDYFTRMIAANEVPGAAAKAAAKKSGSSRHPRPMCARGRPSHAASQPVTSISARGLSQGGAS